MSIRLFLFSMLVFFGLLLSSEGYALDRLVLNESQSSYSLGAYVNFIEDPSGVLTIADITSQAYERRFLPNNNEIFSAGYSQSAYWLRFAISPTSVKKNWYLEIPFPLLDYIDLYIPQESGGFKRYQQGDAYPFSQRSIASNHFIFNLNIAHTSTYYIRVKTRDSIQVPLILNSESALRDSNGMFFLLQGAYFGLMLAMILYNVFIYFSVRDKTYLYYIFYIASFTFLQSGIQGFNFRFLWPESPEWGNTSLPVLSLVMVFFGARFTRSILQIESYSVLLDRSLNVLSVVALVIVPVMLFAPYSIGILLTISLCFVFFNLALIAGIVGLRKKVRAARYFVIAWATYLISGSVYVLMIIGYLPVNVFSLHAIQVGSAIEVILLSLALADRINSLKYEKALVERESMEALAQVNKRLERSNTFKDEFISTVSHEIRTPMNGVVGMSEILLGTELNAEQQEYLRIISQSGKSLVEILNRVLDYSKIDSGELTLHYAPFNVRRLLTECKELFCYQSMQSGVPVNIIVDDMHELIVSDPLRIKQILINLIGNGLKFTKIGHLTLHASLEYREGTHYLSIRVIDTGIGIPKDKSTLIFDAFSQADSSTSRAYGGTGLGLAISKKLVNKMGGEIDVESELGVGTTFQFSVRIDLTNKSVPDNQTTFDDAAQVSTESNRFSSLRVLVVEDNPVNQIVLCGLLKKLGIRADKVDGGMQAIECITSSEHDFDLVLMDCEMPEMDGFEAARKIKMLYSDISFSKRRRPIIYAVSAHDKRHREAEALLSGMSGYLEKPLHLSVLRALIEGTF